MRRSPQILTTSLAIRFAAAFLVSGRLLRSAMLVFATFVFSLQMFGQVNPNLEVGNHPFGGSDDSNMDSVNLASGGLSVDIPLFSIPQRGALQTTVKLILGGRPWVNHVECVPAAQPYCNTFWVYQVTGGANLAGFSGMALIVDDSIPRASFSSQVSSTTSPITPNPVEPPSPCDPDPSNSTTGKGTPCTPDPSPDVARPQSTITPKFATNPQTWTWSAISPDGSSHKLFPTQTFGTTWLSADETGIVCQGCSADGALDPTTEPITVYTKDGRYFDRSRQLVGDANGNVISLLSGGIDTMGRPSPYLVTPITDPTTEGCSGPRPTTTASIMNYPGVGDGPHGTSRMVKLCYTSMDLHTNFNQEYNDMYGNVDTVRESTYRSLPFLQKVILYNGVSWSASPSWTFEYNNNISGNDSTGIPVENYGDLTKITLPTGGTVSYTWLTNSPPCAQYLTTAVGRWVSSRTADPQDGTPPMTSLYDLWGGVTQGGPNGQRVVHTFDTLTGTNYSGQCPAYETNTQWFDANSNVPLKEVDRTYSSQTILETSDVGPLPVAFYILPIVTTSKLADGTTSAVQMDYDSSNYGTVSEIREYAYGVGSPGSEIRCTDITYRALDGSASSASYLNANLLDLPTSKKIYAGSCGGSLVSQTTYGYDEFSLQSSGISTGMNNAGIGSFRGNQTSIHRLLLPGGSSVNSSRTFYDTGNPFTATDPDGNTTTFFYSAAYAGAYLTGTAMPVTNGVPHQIAATYDFNTGRVTSYTGQNGEVSNYAYDALGRIWTAHLPDAGLSSSSLSKAFCYPNLNTVSEVSAQGNALSASGTSFNCPAASGGVVATALFDGLGRKYRSTLLEDGGGTINTDTTYDSLGNVHSVANPYRSASDSTFDLTLFQYDALGRKLSAQHQADGTAQTWTYNGNATTFTDEAGNQWRDWTDALGRLQEIQELGSTINPLNLETDYGYDALDNLTYVNQHGAISETPRTRSFSYDSLSRLLVSSNPETGTIRYNSYDPNGNLLNKTDANNITTSYAYDALNRLTSQISSDGSISNQFYYDSSLNLWGTPHPCTNGIGRLCLADHGGVGGTAFDYDAMGRVSDTKYAVITAQPTYVPGLAAVYDLAGNMTQLSYPDGRQVSQTFDGAGRLATVSSGGTTYIGGVNGSGSIAYTPSGAVQGFAFGNGVSQTNLYNSRLQPCHTMVSSPLFASNPTGGNLLDRASYYSPLGGSPTNCGNEAGNNGNMYAVVDNLNTGWSQGFTYDSLNRLTSAGRSDGGYNHTYNYDSFGNLIVQDNLHTNLQYAIDPSTNELLMNPLAPGLLDQYGHQMNAFQYDFAGNMVSSGINNIGGHQYAYNALSQVMSVDGGATASYAYNGSDERELKVTPSGWTEYVYFNGQPMSEQTSSGVWSDYIYANGEKIAKVDSAVPLMHIAMNFAGNGASTLLAIGAPNVSGLVIQPGDNLAFSVKSGGGVMWGAGFWQTTPQGQLIGSTTFDQNGQSMSYLDISDGAWHDETGSIGANAGNSLATVLVALQPGTQAGPIDVWLKDLVITHANGSVTPVLTTNQASLTPEQEPGPTVALSATPENVAAGTGLTLDYNPVAISQAEGTTYFVDDHLGTAQVQLSGGGWPIWQGQFTPFGAELPDGSTDMHYKFTGKERDNETGLDYFGARYYASNMGRWMSPDWATKAEPVPYAKLDDPQSLNLYGYVGNNPLSRTDADGHQWPDWVQRAWKVISYPGILNDSSLSPAQKQAAVRQAVLQHNAAGRQLLADGVALLAAAASAEAPTPSGGLKSSMWDLAPSPRGFAIEAELGANLPRNFPTIDKFDNGAATSIKSIDLNANSYQNSGALTSTVNGYIDKVAGFNGASSGGVEITAGEVTSRELQLAVPGAGTAAQQAALRASSEYAAQQGVKLTITQVK